MSSVHSGSEIDGALRSNGLPLEPDRAGVDLEPNGARGLMLRLLGALAPFSVFLPYLPAFASMANLLCIAVIAMYAPRARSLPLLVAPVLLLFALSVVSLIWSPDAQEPISFALYFALLAGSLLAGVALNGDVSPVVSMVKAWCASALVNSVLVIYFSQNPSSEISWLKSSFASVAINEGTLKGLFSGAPNNILDPAKSGAFFVNANAGSAFIGAALALSVGLWRSTGRLRWMVAGVIHAVAIVASGSATGATLLIVFVSYVVVKEFRKTPAFAILAPPFALLATALLVRYSSALQSDADVTDRSLLWRYALQAISTYPITGLGYGGWQEYASKIFSLIGSSQYPPHNLLLYTSVQIGLAGGFAVLFFYIAAVGATFRGYDPLFSYAGCAILWAFLHSMGDNTGVFNDYHSMPVLAIVLGAALKTRSTN